MVQYGLKQCFVGDSSSTGKPSSSPHPLPWDFRAFWNGWLMLQVGTSTRPVAVKLQHQPPDYRVFLIGSGHA